MFILNKIVWSIFNPVAAVLIGAVAGFILMTRHRRLGGVMVAASLALLWFASTPMCACILGLPLEKPYVGAQNFESLPEADAIVVLGGGISKSDRLLYPEMFDAADRVWHAARLWKARKAPIVITSGSNDLASTVPLLKDFGVPSEAIVSEDESRNTYENSRFTEKLLKKGANVSPTILLVTSAWHMKRAAANFAKTSLKVVPAPCDYSAHTAYYSQRLFFEWFLPSADSLARTNFFFKEWLGRFARR
jgi:uncharacterized SAM-binding protein YcdF (DUF218 family)